MKRKRCEQKWPLFGSPPTRGRGLKLLFHEVADNELCRPPRGGVD